MFDFPASPSPGALYQPAGGPTYQWDGQKWIMAGSAIQQTPAYVRRNRIVNPSMQISQENGSTAITASGAFAVDQWGANFPSGAVTSQQVTVAGPTPNRFRYTVTTGAAVVAGGACNIQTKIEGLNLADLNWGASPAVPVVVRFLLKAPAGTYSMNIRNGLGTPDRSYNANFTVSAAQANTDVVWTFAVPGDTTGTWAKDNTIGMFLQVSVAAASDRIGVAGWQAGNFTGATGLATTSTSGQVFELGDVGLYADPQGSGLAPAYETPAYASELIACRRYWQQSRVFFGGYASTGAGTYAFGTVGVAPRIAPALSGVDQGGSVGFAATVGSLGMYGAMVLEIRTATGTGAGTFNSIVTASARM